MVQFNPNYTPFISSTPLVSNNPKPAEQSKVQQGQDFKSLLQQQVQNKQSNLTFSKHAMQRIGERQLEVAPKLISQISNAVERAADKGIRNALILGNDTAFIVNVPGKTVVTAMSSQEMKNNIITNIDGTVIL